MCRYQGWLCELLRWKEDPTPRTEPCGKTSPPSAASSTCPRASVTPSTSRRAVPCNSSITERDHTPAAPDARADPARLITDARALKSYTRRRGRAHTSELLLTERDSCYMNERAHRTDLFIRHNNTSIKSAGHS
ncbi:hypothetical protein WMY93_025843 [Mugilogobius chulae]|uniref:Uncharacterized protein n=1 Tax=Mugilogobius chulae TaxID=88201 RepID=A0AAW0N2G4_9GOBI